MDSNPDFPALQALALHRGHRLLLVLHTTDNRPTGEVIRQLQPVGLCAACTIVPDAQDRRDRQDRIDALLGDETACLCFDARRGFDPSLFAAAAGSVIAGGVLLLLCPPLADWPRLPDADYALAGTASGFIERLAGILHHRCRPIRNAPGWLHLRSADPHAAESVPLSQPPQAARSDQDRLLQRALDSLQRSPTTVVAVRADRGHGKSALLGRLYRALTQQGQQPLVTATRAGATRVLARHAGTEIRFRSVARLLDALPPDTDSARQAAPIVLIDEAATLPLSTLQRLLQRYPRAVLASTVHGYEGAGRGFALRLEAMLADLHRPLLTLAPASPFRWAEDDPLQALVNEICLLDAEPSAPADPPHAARVPAYPVLRERSFSAQDWLAEESLLRQTFGLLLQAHYQTTPMDLRHLLDRSDLTTRVLLSRGNVIGALLYTQEGAIDAQLHTAIIRRQRRPHNQLLPQQLAQSLGSAWPLTQHYYRIIRIAVLPGYRRQGIGTALLDALAASAAPTTSALGASFGKDPASAAFWQAAGYTAVHTGLRINPRSGQRSMTVMQALHDDETMHAHIDAASVLHQSNLAARRRLGQACTPDSSATMPPVAGHGHRQPHALIPDDSWQLQQFAAGNRSFVDTAAALERHIHAVPGIGVARGSATDRQLERKLRNWLQKTLPQ